MADLDFENPTFDLDGPGSDDDYSFDLLDASSRILSHPGTIFRACGVT